MIINFQTYSKILKITIRKAKSNYYHSQFQLFKNDTRKTWTTINELIDKTKKKTEFPRKMSHRWGTHFRQIGNCLVIPPS